MLKASAQTYMHIRLNSIFRDTTARIYPCMQQQKTASSGEGQTALLRTFETDLPLSETACKGNKETLFSAVANRIQIRVWEKQHQTSAVCPNYNPPVWRPSDNNDNNEAALAETSSDHARGWQRHPDQLCRHYAVLSSSPCKSYKIIEALSLTEFHYQVIVRLNVYTAIYIYCIYIIYILLLLVSSSCSY